jgi:hypothetical protein
MKMNKLIISLSAVALGALVVGCDSKKQPSDPSAPPTPETQSTTDAGATLKDAATQAVESAKQTAAAVTEQAKTAATAAVAEAKQVATNAVEQVKAAAATATTEAQQAVGSAQTTAQSWIDQAKTYVSEKKYQDALASLKELTGYQLTPEQQQTVSNLQATIQSALGSDAAKAIGGWLKK